MNKLNHVNFSSSLFSKSPPIDSGKNSNFKTALSIQAFPLLQSINKKDFIPLSQVSREFRHIIYSQYFQLLKQTKPELREKLLTKYPDDSSLPIWRLAFLGVENIEFRNSNIDICLIPPAIKPIKSLNSPFSTPIYVNCIETLSNGDIAVCYENHGDVCILNLKPSSKPKFLKGHEKTTSHMVTLPNSGIASVGRNSNDDQTFVVWKQNRQEYALTLKDPETDYERTVKCLSTFRGQPIMAYDCSNIITIWNEQEDGTFSPTHHTLNCSEHITSFKELSNGMLCVGMDNAKISLVNFDLRKCQKKIVCDDFIFQVDENGQENEFDSTKLIYLEEARKINPNVEIGQFIELDEIPILFQWNYKEKATWEGLDLEVNNILELPNQWLASSDESGYVCLWKPDESSPVAVEEMGEEWERLIEETQYFSVCDLPNKYDYQLKKRVRYLKLFQQRFLIWANQNEMYIKDLLHTDSSIQTFKLARNITILSSDEFLSTSNKIWRSIKKREDEEMKE